jgi:spore coat protein U-like protein
MWTVNRFLFALLLAFIADGAVAQVTTCSASNTSLSLGSYPSFNATAVDSSGTFIVTCSRSGGPGSTNVTVGFGPSFNSGSISTRQLKLTSGSDLLSYNLYRDATRLAVWGQTAGVDTVTQSINLANNTSGTLTFNIFGRINALQDVRAGIFNDQLTITVIF